MAKRMLSMVLAGILVLSVSSVSQAEDGLPMNPDTGKYESGEITAEGEYDPPTIKVEMSDTMTGRKLAINPYGLQVSLPGTMIGDPSQKEQLVNSVQTIKNKSEIALAVNATVQAKVVSPVSGSKLKPNIKMAAEPIDAATETSNSVFAFLNIKANTVQEPMLSEDIEYQNGDNQIVFATKAATKRAMVTLDSGNKAGGKNVASYKILGNVAMNPQIPWTPVDKVDFSIIFDFELRKNSD